MTRREQLADEYMKSSQSPIPHRESFLAGYQAAMGESKLFVAKVALLEKAIDNVLFYWHEHAMNMQCLNNAIFHLGNTRNHYHQLTHEIGEV